MKYLAAYNTDIEKDENDYKLSLPNMTFVRDTEEVTMNPKGPYDAEIEYLKGASATIINTGIAGNNNIQIEVKYIISAHQQYGPVLGNYIDENTNCFRILLQSSNNNNAYANVNTKASISGGLTGGGTKNTPIIVKISKTKITVNGNNMTCPTANGNNNTTNIALFAGNTTSSPSGVMGVKIIYCKIKENNNLVRDFIPVRIGQVGYMYDKISKQLFGNISTGNFVLGPDKV